MVTPAVIQLLLGVPQLLGAAGQQQAQIFGLIGRRVYLDHAPQGIWAGNPPSAAPPQSFVVVRKAAETHIKGMQGGRAGVEKGLALIDVYADTPANASALQHAIGVYLDGYRGPAGPPPPAVIQGIFEEDSSDDYLPPVHGDEGLPDVVMAFTVWKAE